MPVYSLGSNGSGQLGLGHEEDVDTPTRLDAPPVLHHTPVTSIRAGGNHTLLQTSSSEIYATGNSNNGRCASLASQSVEFSLSVVPKTKLLAATWEASIFVSDNDGSVHVCGTGLKGELGLGAMINQTDTPTSIAGFPPQSTQIVDLAACMGHVVAVLSNGEVWGWGSGQQGQLGHPAEVVWQPRRVEGLPFKAVRAVCGKDFTAVFSDSNHGDVGGWTDVQATWGGVYVLMEDGSLIAWGRDDHGQLPPNDLPKAKAIAAGSEHVLALAIDGRVLAWGWGEHGNCGEDVDERKDVKGRWNELAFIGEAISVGAGCATSWIITSAG